MGRRGRRPRGDEGDRASRAQGLRFDLRVVPPECYGNLLQHFTGSKQHNVAMREEAQRHGFSISEYGVTVVDTGEVVTHRDETGALRAISATSFIPPELRENTGELEAARAGTLPKLVELRDLKGDLHAHTTWSADGQATRRGDGSRGARTAATSTSPSPTIRTTCARAGWRRRRARSTR